MSRGTCSEPRRPAGGRRNCTRTRTDALALSAVIHELVYIHNHPNKLYLLQPSAGEQDGLINHDDNRIWREKIRLRAERKYRQTDDVTSNLKGRVSVETSAISELDANLLAVCSAMRHKEAAAMLA